MAGGAEGDASAGQVYSSRTTYSTLMGAGGADTFNASEAGDTLTGGAGTDVFHLGVKPWDPIHIADFQVGADRLDLSDLLRQAGYTGSDPIADQYISFGDDGAGGTRVMFDRDGAGTGQAWPDRIIELDNLRYDPAAAGQMLATSGPALPAGGAFVLFAGQSNMGGAYTSAGNVDPAWKPDALTFIWQPVAHAWVQMDPGTNTGWSVPEQPDAWGPEVEFAIRFRAAHPDTPLYIVKDVHGGTDLASQWNPANAGHLFDEVTAMVTQAGGALGGRKPDVLFWGQGEEDGMSDDRAKAYEANLTNFFAAARSKWLSAADAKIAFFEVNTVSPYSAEVRHAQVDVDAADPNAASFDTASYPIQPGEDHFTPAALNEVGRQFYDLYAGQAPAGGGSAGGGSSGGGSTGGGTTGGGDTSSSSAEGHVYTSPGPNSVETGTSGADTFNASQGYDTLTGGAGNDVFVLGQEPWAPITVTDFSVGTDKLDLSALFNTAGYAGSDPVADRYIYLLSDGAGGTIVRYDHDGGGPNPQWPNTVLNLQHVSPDGLTWAQLSVSGGTATSGGSTGGTSTGDGSTGGGSTGGGSASGTTGQVYTSPGPSSVETGTAGNDTFNASQGYDTLTGGAGADVFNLPSEPWAPIHITDFTAGTDKIDLRALFTAAGYSGSNPVADHYILVASDGNGGSIIRFDRDGGGPNPEWPNTIVDLEHVAPAQASASDWIIQ